MKPMQFFDAPPLRYFGAKWQLADWIISQMPPHTLYCEPFCGGAAVFFRKPLAALNVLNDINGDVVNFFRVLRERRDELIEAINLTPWSREEYEQALSSFDDADTDPLERARRMYIIANQSFSGGGTGNKKTGWRHQINFNRGTAVTGEWSRLTGLQLAAARLKNAQIENDHALKVIERYDSTRTLFYVDPPYVIQSRARAAGRYHHEMNEQDHRDLAARLQQLDGYVLLSGYRSDLYEELYAGWTCLQKSTTTSGNSVATEYLWLSPNTTAMNSLPLFSSQ